MHSLRIVRERSATSMGRARLSTREYMEKCFGNVVLEDSIRERMLSITTATLNTRKNKAPFRNMCFYGPPGTGKTLVARTLAKSSGLDYAIMSGGDVGPLGPDAVPQIHALFEWAKQSSRGLLLFIDEAETFLASRAGSGMSQEHHNALNALLYNTGTQSHNFVMVRYQYPPP